MIKKTPRMLRLFKNGKPPTQYLSSPPKTGRNEKIRVAGETASQGRLAGNDGGRERKSEPNGETV